MPKGIPVATVAINNAANAALLAIRMLSISDEKNKDQAAGYTRKMADMSREKTLK
jgi:phosphoribosylcarboxyaminoimidazole (NCAIR) mutase